MRTGAAAGHVGYYHEALLFDSDEHLLAVVLPFLLGGVEPSCSVASRPASRPW
ncbi:MULTISPECIES: MEDS domain-containing protein [Micromonospora]|uniref:MEDS domain-containing protein n=1 Tax=Micromonospora TaxID=1873 RepID=UPI001EF05871|nr:MULTISPECIES: MEDS domain-containing protein [unclassified Micromonospora]